MSGQSTGNARIHRRDLAKQIISRAEQTGALVVTGLGSTAWDSAAAGDRDLTFPLWGAMGGAAAMGLGLAQAQPDRQVIVMTGDGEMLMGVGTFATIGANQPDNLSIAVFDNEHYGETGMQAGHSGGHTDMALMARGGGIADADLVTSPDDMVAAVDALFVESGGPVVRVFKIEVEDLPLVMPPKDGAWLKDRFRRALLGEKQAADLRG